MNGNQIAGLWLLNTAIPLFTVLVAWRLGWLQRARAGLRGWLDWLVGEPPHERTLEEYNNQYAHEQDYRDDGLTVAEAIAAVPELDLDGTQPIEQVYQDPPAGTPVLVPVQGEYVPVTYEPPVDALIGQERGDGHAGDASDHRGPGWPVNGAPFHPHAGPPAWRPRHAKTSWLDELITEALGAPTVEHYMWNWQQRHRLAITA